MFCGGGCGGGGNVSGNNHFYFNVIYLLSSGDLDIPSVSCGQRHDVEVLVKRMIYPRRRTLDPNLFATEPVCDVHTKVLGISKNVRNDLLSKLWVMFWIMKDTPRNCTQ